MNAPTFFYFAYGSNMLIQRLRRRTPSAKPVERGWLNDYSLVFRKQSSDGSGKCDVVPASKGEAVQGVVYSIRTTELPELDRAEGVGHGYSRGIIHVAVDGNRECECVYYYATDWDASLRPYDWYKRLVLSGLEQHKLPATYRDEIEKVEAIPDPKSNRPARLEALEVLNEYERTKLR